MVQSLEKLISTLNKEQREAVHILNGPLLVLAGAGTGKTRVITFRIAHMISKGIPPSDILGMTFTNKAAKEMKERLSAIVPTSDANKVFLGTFHSFCARFLRREIEILGYGKNFTITDDSDQKGMIKQIFAYLNIHKDHINPATCLSLISNTKSAMLTPYEMDIPDSSLSALFPRIYDRYQRTLKNQNMVDFDDLLLLTVNILDKYPDTLKKYQSRHPYILVDEYQDTNTLQFRLLQLLAGESQNLCVVGDDDQSIYGWRGAKIENILNFPSHFRGGKEIKLEQNYRSTNTILEGSNAVISKNSKRHDKKLWSDCGDGELIKVICANTEIDEGKYVADAISQYKNKVPLGEIAVLYRSNYQSRQIEDALRSARINYRLVGSKSFYERKEIRDAIAYLKLVVNHKDDQSLLRILGSPPRGIGDKSIDRLRELQNITTMPMTELLKNKDYQSQVSAKAATSSQALIDCVERWKRITRSGGSLSNNALQYLKEVGYLNGLITMYKKREEAEKRRDNVFELINAIRQFELKQDDEDASLLDFLESYSLADDNDKVDEDEDNSNSVTLMTIHAAKGLEFQAIFLIGVEEKLFPNERALIEGSVEEERRLFYVAMTRAKAYLTLIRTRSRMRFGKSSRPKKSRFLYELPKDLVEEKDALKAFTPVSIEAMQKAFDNFSF